MSQMWDPQGPWREYCALCAKMHLTGYVAVRHWPPPALPGLLAETIMEDPGVCTGPPILGRESQSAHARQTPSFSNEHTWIKAVYEKIYYLPMTIKPPVADSPAVLAIVPSVLENMSATLIAIPARSEEESVTCVTISTASADEPANPLIPSKTTGNVRSPTESEYLRRVKVYLSHMAASIGSIPCNMGDLRKTLVYAQALQYWAEKANLPMPGKRHHFSNEHTWIKAVYEKIYYLPWPLNLQWLIALQF